MIELSFLTPNAHRITLIWQISNKYVLRKIILGIEWNSHIGFIVKTGVPRS